MIWRRSWACWAEFEAGVTPRDFDEVFDYYFDKLIER